MKKILSIVMLITILISSLTIPALAADEIVITTSDALCKMEGSGWTESTNEKVAGPTGGTSWYTDDKNATAAYDASALAKGNYGVYLYMTPFGTTADRVDVTITASGKPTTLTIDAMHGGLGKRHWLFLGKYDFNGSVGDGVVQQINAAAEKTNGTAAKAYMRASGVKFVKDDANTSAPETLTVEVVAPTVTEDGIVITTDNKLCKLQGSGWKESTSEAVAGPLGGTSWYSTNKEVSALYDASLLEKGNYGVYLYVTPWGSTSDVVDVTITASGKSTTIVTNGVDGGLGNRHWIFLGKYDFDGSKGDSVLQKRNAKATDGTMRASAVKFVKDDTNTEDIASYNPPSLSEFFGTELHILERMGMLIGEGEGITAEYIKKVPTRVQAAIMILRLNGVDAEAAAFAGEDNFSDAYLEAWAMPYLAYLKAHPELGLIGTGDNMFEPTAEIDAQAYAKILLTALGYEYNVDFTWDETLAFAKEKGIAEAPAGTFTVKDLAVMTESIMDLNCKDGSSYFTKLILERDGVKDEGVYGTELPAELKAARDAAKNKDRGIIYNNDGNDTYKKYAAYPGAFDISHLDGTTINTENFLKTRSYGLEDTQVGTVFYCTGVFNSYTHESVGITDTRVRDWSRVLKDYTGKDSLTTMVDYVHSVGKDIFWSMRMNDTHDYKYEENELDPWKQKNMDLLMYRKADKSLMQYGANRWSSVDYTLMPVRQVVYDILKDTITRYDIDGLELDLTRWPIFFKEQAQGYDIYPENVERMNNLVRMVRDLTEKISIERNKPILLAVYAPDSLDFCYDIGCDIKTWLEEDLVDIISIGCHSGVFKTWEDAIAEYKDYDVPVFAALDPLGYDKKSGLGDYEVDKKEAALAYAAGADGIYTYNYFDINHERFDTLGSPETCGPVDPGYVSARKPYKGKLIKDGQKYVTFQK